MIERGTDPTAGIRAIPSTALRTKSGAGATSTPTEAVLVRVEGVFHDDAAWRHFVAGQLATQTLSQQRAEWYSRSTRLHVMWAFWLTMACAVLAAILLAV